MAKVHGGWLVVRTLYELGVREIFSLSGGHINPIYDACVDFGIRIIDTHHEQAAAMAADAFRRVKRQPGVCLVTAGPGFTNAVTGIAGAYLSNSPCLLLSGKSGIEENDRLPLQDIDQQSVITPITKWARTIFDTKRIPEYISTAYKKAISGKPGPVYLGMPYEVLYESCNEEEIDRYNTIIPSYKVEAAREVIAQAVEMLKSARRPVAIAGSGAWYSGADKELIRILDKVKIPIFTLNFGRGIVSDDHPLCFGAASPSAPVAFKRITSEADWILLLGIRLSLYIGFGRTFNPEAKIIQVDIDPGEIGRNRPADLGIVGDVSKVLSQLSDYVEKHSINLNYKSWGMTKHQLWITYGRERPTVGVDLPLIPFHEMVKVLGGYGELVTEPAQIHGALIRAFSSGVPALLNVTTDPEAISPATYALTQMMMPKKK